MLTHGANPGLVSHFVKQALLNVAADTGVDAGTPKSRDDWGQLARKLGIKVIHIAERDTQLASKPKEFNEFVNTWSVDGFVSEGQQPAELGWGTHEKNFPRDGKRYDFGNGSAIYLMQPGAATRVRTWTPKAGHFHGFLITHGEAISIADYLSVRQSSEVVYRPTVHYAYHPSDSAVVSVHEFAGPQLAPAGSPAHPAWTRSLSGIDELGVLLAGHKKNAYWYGSQLSIDEARKLAPHNNATSLQVTVSCLSGMIWAMENPNAGPGRARRDRLRAQPRDLHAVSRHGHRRLHRLDAAARSRAAVPGRSRQDRSLAVQERARLSRSRSAPSSSADDGTRSPRSQQSPRRTRCPCTSSSAISPSASRSSAPGPAATTADAARASARAGNPAGAPDRAPRR